MLLDRMLGRRGAGPCRTLLIAAEGLGGFGARGTFPGMSQAERPGPSAAMQAFQEKFAALQRDWQSQLPQRLREIRAGLDACLAAPGDEAALVELHRMLHSIAGSAASFGMTELGQHAAQAEYLLDPLMGQADRQAAHFAPAGLAVACMERAAQQA
jgi:HPt (histidine-containing phosphotransfer) domain-containing protein